MIETREAIVFDCYYGKTLTDGTIDDVLFPFGYSRRNEDGTRSRSGKRTGLLDFKLAGILSMADHR